MFFCCCCFKPRLSNGVADGKNSVYVYTDIVNKLISPEKTNIKNVVNEAELADIVNSKYSLAWHAH